MIIGIKQGKCAIYGYTSREIAAKVKQVDRKTTSVETISRKIRRLQNTGETIYGYQFYTVDEINCNLIAIHKNQIVAIANSSKELSRLLIKKAIISNSNTETVRRSICKVIDKNKTYYECFVITFQMKPVETRTLIGS